MRASLLIVFKALYPAYTSAGARVLGSDFTLSFVVVIVRGVLVAIGPSTRSRARPRGQGPPGGGLVILPLLWPAISPRCHSVRNVARDFVIASFLIGAGTETVPIRIYSSRAVERRRPSRRGHGHAASPWASADSAPGAQPGPQARAARATPWVICRRQPVARLAPGVAMMHDDGMFGVGTPRWTSRSRGVPAIRRGSDEWGDWPRQ